MTTGEDQNQTAPNPRPKGIVRWLAVVLLGFVLGLMVTYVAYSFRVMHSHGDPGRIIYRVRGVEPGMNVSDGAAQTELTNVIESQLAAFRKNDFTSAYAFAASPLKEHISLPAFEQMVRNGYPLIARARRAQFGVMLDNGEEALVNVVIFGESGGSRHYQYLLHRERKNWRISGVVEIAPSGTTI